MNERVAEKLAEVLRIFALYLPDGARYDAEEAIDKFLKEVEYQDYVEWERSIGEDL